MGERRSSEHPLTAGRRDAVLHSLDFSEEIVDRLHTTLPGTSLSGT